MIVHLVMWKFKSGAPLKEIKSRLEGMKGKIGFILDLEVGVDILRSERSWDMSLMVKFSTKKELETYGTHPASKLPGKFIPQAQSGEGMITLGQDKFLPLQVLSF